MASILVRDSQFDGSSSIVDPPCCQHGPTLLFMTKNSEESRPNFKNKKRNNWKQLEYNSNSSVSNDNYYYACSVSRDHKFCPFRMERDRWLREQNKPNNQLQSVQHENEFLYFLNETAEDSSKSFSFCHDCCRVLVDMNLCDEEDHEIPIEHCLDYHQTKLNCSNISSKVEQSFFHLPSKLLSARTSNENQAQYFFADSVVKYLIDYVIIPMEFDRILCLGCPTIHEQICHNDTVEARSLLLDIDPRFGQFYSAKQFIRFNMFNNHFFDSSGKRRLKKFLKNKQHKILLLVDPPFGGLIECLADTCAKISEQHLPKIGENCPRFSISTILFFPYFNEHWIRRSFADELKITDFIVTYRNHGKFSGKKLENSILSSPVRMFTNIDLSLLDFRPMNRALNIESLYRWCSICQRYIFKTNKHCSECNECSARDASKSVRHCKLCGHCVKETWKHCTQCNRCHLESNNCKLKKFENTNTNKKERKF